jgi:hypothetical protein
MPPLAAYFAQRISEALALAQAGDSVIGMAEPRGHLRQEWHVTRVELLYELAYLRIFIEWETFLEQTFLRYLCGYISVSGSRYTSITGGFRATLQAAEIHVLGGRQYLLWHNPRTISNPPGKAA